MPERTCPPAVEIASNASSRSLVLLVHGIRTQADWQQRVAAAIEENTNAEVIPFKYDFLDVISFWLPGPGRTAAINRILRRLRSAISRHHAPSITIIAHSFATYAVCRILEDNPDIRLHRVIFCGSIVRTDYRWDKVAHQIETEVTNEVGSKDLWPVLAQCLSWGYGATGVFGFGDVGVQDRFHNLRHSDFLNAEFARTFWVPLITNNEFSRSKWDKERPASPWRLSLLSILPLQNILVVILLCTVAFLIWGSYTTQARKVPYATFWDDYAVRLNTAVSTAFSELEKSKDDYDSLKSAESKHEKEIVAVLRTATEHFALKQKLDPDMQTIALEPRTLESVTGSGEVSVIPKLEYLLSQYSPKPSPPPDERWITVTTQGLRSLRGQYVYRVKPPKGDIKYGEFDVRFGEIVAFGEVKEKGR